MLYLQFRIFSSRALCFYYMSLEASLVMDAQAHDDGKMGDKEYYLRTGAKIGGLIPGPVMQTASYGPTVYDAYGCLASAYYVGNYD